MGSSATPRSTGGESPALAAAVIRLIEVASDTRPMLVTVDDAHWLDQLSAQLVGYVARRLTAVHVAMVITVELGQPFPYGASLPSLVLSGIEPDEAARLLAAAGHAVAPKVVAHLVTTTGGNPLALLELAALLQPAQLTGQAAMPHPLPLTARAGRTVPRPAGSCWSAQSACCRTGGS